MIYPERDSVSFFNLDPEEQQGRIEEVSALAELMMNQNDSTRMDYQPGTLNRLGTMIWQRLH